MSADVTKDVVEKTINGQQVCEFFGGLAQELCRIIIPEKKCNLVSARYYVDEDDNSRLAVHTAVNSREIIVHAAGKIEAVDTDARKQRCTMIHIGQGKVLYAAWQSCKGEVLVGDPVPFALRSPQDVVRIFQEMSAESMELAHRLMRLNRA